MKILSYLFFAFIAIVIVSANMDWDFPPMRLVRYLPFRDKAGHFILIGGLAFFTNMLAKCRQVEIGRFKFLLGSLAVFAFITLEEFSQIFLDNRTFDLLDLSCNYLGIFVFGKIALWVWGKSKS